jgi:pimeloyl-ACP methyl ester carboxylesterase
MQQLSRVLAPALLAALLAACSKEPPPAPSAASVPAVEPTAKAEGAAQIAIARDGIHVQYRVWGSGEPALVLIHGWSCDSNYWREQIPELKKKYTIVAVDLAGHGGTDGNRSEWTMARFAGDVSAALAAVPNQKLILIGHSMGGPVALEATRLMKDRVIGIIGVDTFKEIGAPKPTQAQVDAFVKPMEENFIGATRDLITQHFFTPKSDPALIQKIAYDMSLSPPRIAIPAIRGLFAMDYEAVVKDISVPIAAIESSLGEPVNETRIKKLIPSFHSVTIPDSGHFLMMEDPARFNPVLEAEIQRILAPAGS